MNAISIRSAYFNSAQDEEESRALRQELFTYTECDNAIKLLYVTPEKFSRSPSFKSLLSTLYQKGLLSRFTYPIIRSSSYTCFDLIMTCL
jgi:superfamily II DNA helicase RecQ